MGKTIKEVIKRNHEDMTFEARARAFEEAIKPLCEEWGTVPWATLQSNENSIVALPAIKDIWQKA